MRSVDEATVINELIERLHAAHDLNVADVTALVNAELERFNGCKVREFVPLFVKRRARVTLSKMQPALSWSS